MEATTITRRGLLRSAAAGAVVAVAGGCGLLPTGGRSAPVPGVAFADPPQRLAGAGRPVVDLTAAPGAELGGVPGAGLGYEGTSPGPTLRVRPGEELALRLHNRLDVPTNLHTHGLRVPPAPDGDDPFRTVEPGGSADYRIRIPADHPAGTFWYHPHHHGTVADQVFGGLVGALVVEGGPDLGTAAEHVLVITDSDLAPARRGGGPGPMERMAGREGDTVLLNGRLQPVLGVVPERSERWRLLNATCSRVLDVGLEGHRLLHVATDGVFLPRPASRDRVRLAPGNRADVVVRPSRTPGRYALLAESLDRGGPGAMAGTGPTGGGPVVLGAVDVGGRARPTPEPPAVLAVPAALPRPGRTRTITLDGGGAGMGTGMGTGMGMRFGIDGRAFAPDRDDIVIRAGTVEDWVFDNPGPMLHPVHLHTWPLVPLDDDAYGSAGTARDVVVVPAGGRVRVRVAFTGATGRTVLHCHVLDHEDLGMMATVVVDGPVP
ncbi:multicopper oxidase family protein [Pseudonocardia spirodelae]|uniref:Multicopper oxidase family protein n=1 Tax=Pseudonocardia spirodelae TaxID=3133431 RepID=A0ABU8T2I8_9PSEU